MEKEQGLQKVSNNVFKKIYLYVRNLFYRENKKVNIMDELEETDKHIEKNDFFNNICVNTNVDNYHLILLKQKFDNKMIDVKDIPLKEKRKLIDMYKKEILEKRKKI